MNNSQIRDKWREAGGSFHGETGTMEETKLLAYLGGLYERISALESSLSECSCDLEAELNARHKGNSANVHPSQQWRYDRDMEPVLRARKLLTAKNPDQQGEKVENE